MKSIRWFSEMNPWIDVVIVVNDEDAKDAYYAVEAARDDYWDEDNLVECYGDCLEYRLEDAGIKPLWTIYHDANREDLEYEEQWEAMLDGIASAAPWYENAIC